MRSPNQFPQTLPNQASNPFDNPFGDAVLPPRQNPFANSPFAPQGGYASPDVFPSNFDPFTPVNYNAAPQSAQEWSPSDYQPARLGERLRDKARPVMEMGRRAVSAIVQFAPRVADRVKQAYYSDYGQKITNVAQGAAGETVQAAAWGGFNAVGDRYGLGYENGRVTVESKRKLARGAFRLLRMPQTELIGAARTAGRGAYAAGRQEATSQAYGMRDTLMTDARGFAQSTIRSAAPRSPW